MVRTSETVFDDEKLICDEKDKPILRATLNAGADLFLTGDNDFLESSVSDPEIISAAIFLVCKIHNLNTGLAEQRLITAACLELRPDDVLLSAVFCGHLNSSR